MSSFAMNDALYRVRKKYGLKGDQRDYPENYVGYNNSNDPTIIKISMDRSGRYANDNENINYLYDEIDSLKDEIKMLKNEISDLRSSKPKVIIIDNSTSIEELQKIREEL